MIGVDAGTNRGAAKVDFKNECSGFMEPVNVFSQHDGKGFELLTQGHRHGVLKLGPTHLQH